MMTKKDPIATRITNDETASIVLAALAEVNPGRYATEPGGRCLVSEDSGAVYFSVPNPCHRCGGSGYGYWYPDGGRCYQCGGRDTSRLRKVVTLVAHARNQRRAYRADQKRERIRLEKIERVLEGQRDWCEKNGYGRITFEEKESLQLEKRASDFEGLMPTVQDDFSEGTKLAGIGVEVRKVDIVSGTFGDSVKVNFKVSSIDGPLTVTTYTTAKWARKLAGETIDREGFFVKPEQPITGMLTATVKRISSFKDWHIITVNRPKFESQN